MNSVQRPFLYDQEKYDDARFPPTTFDPKAVTRASWEVKPPRPKQEGPLVKFNQHPDAQAVLPHRTNNKRIGERTKRWIVRLRIVQLCLRVPELIGAAGVLAMFILLTDVPELTSWIMRIAAAGIATHNAYSIYHLQRPAGERSPASSAGYMVFSTLFDLTGLGLFTFGVIAVINDSMHWGSLIHGPSRLRENFIKTVYYALIATAGLHFVSFLISVWLAYQFRQITRLPPDMNPLESHLTARRVQAGRRRKDHKRNKSSIATTSTSFTVGSTSRLSTPIESHRRSGAPYEDVSVRPPSVPFSHTRRGSDVSVYSKRDSRIELPSHMYQTSPTSPPRDTTSNAQFQAMAQNLQGPARPMSVASMSTSPPSYHVTQPQTQSRALYSGVPLEEQPEALGSRGSSSGSSQGRQPKFTESWMPTKSLIHRTQQRQQMAINNLVLSAAMGDRPYSVVSQRRDLGREDGVSDDSDDENEIVANGGLYDDASRYRRAETLNIAPDDDESDLGSSVPPPVPTHRHTVYMDHHHPLRQNPSTPPRSQTPFEYRPATAVSDASADARAANDSQDIADLTPCTELIDTPPKASRRKSFGRELGKRMTWAGRQRDSSIQPESSFYSKPYGDLRSRTPPEMVTSVNIKVAGAGDSRTHTESPRQVSTGNDYRDMGNGGGNIFARRNVSGKMAEEGRAGGSRNIY
ncbi:hypothetical protein PpBr36_01234 [Pyricularia pennisetigena]|uniref:hypothetical protein n=1 Tax=Pyricularia pennisetigena TaxID=1578925 RepID=UPI00115245DD|nr:hypothetical protein PpBr36_01234 [Pyricularia pennisetigena]TLS28845.1 hypothetical protein PpBr36_01234 [Pyricularia pennisetigena]